LAHIYFLNPIVDYIASIFCKGDNPQNINFSPSGIVIYI